MRTKTAYRNKDGQVIRIPINQVMKHDPMEKIDDFEARVRRTLYQQECEQGSRFNVPGYSNQQLKKVWMDQAVNS